MLAGKILAGSRQAVMHNGISAAIFRKLSSAMGATELKLRLEPQADYTVTEVRIPSIGGYVAGKLWQGRNADGSNPILCMHGWLDNAGTFDPLLPLIMKPDMTALCIDFPGHGLSSHVATVHYDLHVESMLAIKSVMHHYGWEKFSILGHSLGAIVGFVFTGVFPEHVERFIALENVRPIPRNVRAEIRYALSKLLEIEYKGAIGKAPPSYNFDELVKRFYDGRSGTISMEGCRTLMVRGSVRMPNNTYRFAHDPKAVFPTGLWRFSPGHTEELASNIKAPVCFIKGEPGGDYEPRANYDRIVDLMRTSSERLEYHAVPGTHHFHLNDPHSVAPIVSRFLNS